VAAICSFPADQCFCSNSSMNYSVFIYEILKSCG
jgi:hypothetical protein